VAAIASTEIFLFESFRFDRRAGVLFERDQGGVFVPLAVGSRAAEVLGVLIDHPGDLVSRDEIMAAVWPGTVIEDGNLSVQISALRRVLDNGRSEGSLIQTVPGRGYRFLGQVRKDDPDQLPLSPDHCADADADLPQGSPPTVWKRRRENPSLTEAAGSSGCAGVKLRQQMAFARSRQGSGDEGRGALWAGSLCGSD